jgi:hypothetical protein
LTYSDGRSAFRRFVDMSGLSDPAEMPVQYLLGRLDHLDGLPLAHEGEHGALVVAPHTADERDVDVDSCPVSNRVH